MVSLRDPDNVNNTLDVDFNFIELWWLKKYIIEELINVYGETNAKSHLSAEDLLKYKTWVYFRKIKKSPDSAKIEEKRLKYVRIYADLIDKIRDFSLYED